MQPEEKHQELIDRINELTRQRQADEFTLGSIEMKARALIQTDPVSAHVLLGMIATLRRDEKEMRDCYSRAMRIEPENEWTQLNFANSLRNFYRLKEALGKYESVFMKNQGNVEVLRKIVALRLDSFHLKAAKDDLSKLRKLAPEVPVNNEDIILSLADFTEREGIEDGQIQEVVRNVLELYPQSREKMFLTRITHHLEDEDEWVSIHLELDEPVEAIVEKNVELAETMANWSLSPGILNHVNVMFAPSSS